MRGELAKVLQVTNAMLKHLILIDTHPKLLDQFEKLCALVNFSRACKLLDQDPMMSIDIDQACWFWQQKFLGIMEQCILRDPYQKWNVLPGVPNKLWMQFVSIIYVIVEPNKLGTLNLWPNTSQQGISSAFCFQMNSLGLIHDMSVICILVLTPKKVLTLFRNQRQVTNK